MMELQSIENDPVISQFLDLPEISLSAAEIADMIGSNTDLVEHKLRKYYEEDIVINIGYHDIGYGFYRLNLNNPDVRRLVELVYAISLYNSSI